MSNAPTFDRPLLSIVTVARNSAATIAKTIESVLSQNYKAIEYIVIDGNSTDGTVEIVRGYGGRVSRLISERDGGIYFAMNKGLAVSSGSAILFINSDDLFASPDAVRSLIDARSKHSETVPTVCYSDFIKYYPSLNRSLLVPATEEYRRGFTLCHQAMLVDRSAYEKVGVFDTSFRYASDFDWAVRAKRAGVKFVKAPVPPAVIFKHGGASHTSYRESRAEGGAIILREYGRTAYIRYTMRQYWIHVLRLLSVELSRLFGSHSSATLQSLYFSVIRRHRELDSNKPT